MTMNANMVFIDTNVLIYANLKHSPFYAVAQQQLNTLFLQNSTLWVNRQVLREYLSAMTRPNTITGTIPITSLIADVRYFSTQFRVAEDNSQVTENLLLLMGQIAVGGKQIHDANIVATMQAYHIETLLTHNVADFSRFANLINVMPLVGI